jgi:hypothetical protein
MHVFLWIGSALGAVLGLLHGVYLYRQQAAAAGGRAMGLYYGVWAFALWTLFGSYVRAFWILGLVAHTISRLAPRRRSV